MAALVRSKQLSIRPAFIVQFVSWLVGLDGLFVLATTLLDQLAVHRGSKITDIVVDVPLLLGLSFIYLSTLLAKRKRNAWSVALVGFVFMLGLNTTNLLQPGHSHSLLEISRALIVPLTVLGSLVLTRREFSVESDFGAFKASVRFSMIIILVAIAYGVSGFLLFDQSDFHQEISLPGAFQRTIDQFDLTTSAPLHPYTKRAQLFVDSLSFVSVGALAYVAVSFFQPVRARLRNQGPAREQLRSLLERYGAPSEDFFKLWPHDKHYFFDHSQQAGLAYQLRGGIALSLGDPVGKGSQLTALLDEFSSLCYGNDWLPAFIHVEATHQRLYESQGYTLQLIGQEALLDLEHFTNDVVRNKYFRNIANRFKREKYSTEILTPPHHPAVMQRLQAISDEWLDRPGRSERGFVMGYFSDTYMQECPLLVARDAAGTIQGFVNLVPASFDSQEATFDMMRHTNASPGNSNDFMLINLIAYLQEHGYKRLNLGLSPLVGFDDTDTASGLINRVLRFAYVNGDRFYSFSGLHRFKAKYEPEWSDRFIAYKGGVRGFSRTLNGLLRAMSVKT